MLSDDARRIDAPVVVSPVNEILLTRRVATRARRRRPRPGRAAPTRSPRARRPRPAARRACSAVTGVSDAGLMITGLPHASAGAVFHDVISSGKFHGTISAHDADRLAQHDVEARDPAPARPRRSACWRRRRSTRTSPAAASTSQRASPIGLPGVARLGDRERLGPLAQQRRDPSEHPAAVRGRHARTRRRTRTRRARCVTAASTSAAPARAICRQLAAGAGLAHA